MNLGEKWQMDVKFIPKACKANLIDENRYYQYTVIDEASRELFIYPYMEHSSYSTVGFMKRAIAFFGYVPQIIQTDNTDFSQEDVQETMIFDAFPSDLVYKKQDKTVDISSKNYKTVADISEKFKFDFENSGYMLDYKVITAKLVANYDGKVKTLGQCLDCDNVPEYCYRTNVKKFKYLKGSKKIERVAATGHKYMYS